MPGNDCLIGFVLLAVAFTVFLVAWLGIGTLILGTALGLAVTSLAGVALRAVTR